MAGFYVKVEFDEEKFHEAIEEFKKNNPDFVEVVRCENCQFWDNEHISSEGLAKCVTGESGIRYRRSYDFCSHGDRKGEVTSDGRL